MTTIKEPLKYSDTSIEVPLKYSNTPEYVYPPTGACPGCAYGLIFRLFLKASGPKIITTSMPGCGVITKLESDGAPIDSVRSAFGNAVSIAVGVSLGLKMQGDDETVVVPFVGDGCVFDIGMGALSAAAERNNDLLFVVKDNEGYQNTGDQRSSAAPWMSTNTTNPPGFAKVEFKKDIGAIMASHKIPYLATASVAYPDDYMRKVKTAMSMRGFRMIHVFSPCPTGWGFGSELTLELSRLAVESSLFPLYEVKNGVEYTINHQPKGAPLTDYLSKQRRFRDITPEQVEAFEAEINRRWHRLKFLATYDENSK